MSASLVAWLIATLPLAAVLAGIALIVHSPGKPGKALRRAWRCRKRSHRQWRRRHSSTPRFADEPLKRRERRTWDAIEANYAQTAPGHNKPREGPR